MSFGLIIVIVLLIVLVGGGSVGPHVGAPWAPYYGLPPIGFGGIGGLLVLILILYLLGII